MLRLSLLACLLSFPIALYAQQAGPTSTIMTSDNVLQLLGLRATNAEIIALIARNRGNFDLSSGKIAELTKAGANEALLSAMLRANIRFAQSPEVNGGTQSVGGTAPTNPGVGLPASMNQPSGNPTVIAVPPPTNPGADLPPPANQPPGGPSVIAVPPPINPSADLPPPVNPPPGGPVASQKPKTPSYPPNTPERFSEATTKVVTDPTNPNYPPNPPPVVEACPFVKHFHTDVKLNWKTGSNTESSLTNYGRYCFVVTNVNNILYDYSFTLTREEPTQDPLSMMKSTISSLQGLFPGGSTGTPKPQPGVRPPVACDVSLAEVNGAISELDQAISEMQPTKGTSGEIPSVDIDTTLKAWDRVGTAYNAFEESVGRLITKMGIDPNRPNCAVTFAQAEYIILNTYPTARSNYQLLKRLASSRHRAYYESSLDNTYPYDLVVAENYKGQPTTAKSKTFHFDLAYSAITTSGGFLLSGISPRVYSSRTAPNSANPTTTTQNVLGVDFGSGITPSLLVLLNCNPRYVNWKNYGLGISGGPVFNIANGKADTSTLGFFGGISIRMTPWLYLTPGVNVGQFADFPQGYTHAGQVIPPNTGTPVPTKRETARFGFAMTFKFMDLFSKKADTQTNLTNTKDSNNAAQPGTQQNPPSKPAGSSGQPPSKQ
jgi:hypothetical protein